MMFIEYDEKKIVDNLLYLVDDVNALISLAKAKGYTITIQTNQFKLDPTGSSLAPILLSMYKKVM